MQKVLKHSSREKKSLERNWPSVVVRWPGPATNGELVFTHADHGWVSRIPCKGVFFSHFRVGLHNPGPAIWSRKCENIFCAGAAIELSIAPPPLVYI